MRYLVVGGHARGIGKTALVVDIIRAFPEAGWTAVKISPHGHGAWPAGGTQKTGRTEASGAILLEETDRTGHKDSSRYLVAGARRALFLRTRQRDLAQGVSLLRTALAGSEYVILESNAVLNLIRPELFLVVLDPGLREFKAYARRFMDFADGLIVRDSPAGTWLEGLSSRPVFEQRLGEPLPEGLFLLIRNRLFTATHPPTT